MNSLVPIRRDPVVLPPGPPASGGSRTYGPFVIAPAKGAHGGAQKPAPSFLDYFRALYRRRIPVALFVLASVAAAYLVSRRMKPVYEATLTINIDRQAPTSLAGPENAPGGATDLDNAIATHVRLLQSDPVLRPVVKKFHLLEVEDGPIFLKHLRVSRPPNTYLIQVSYRSPNPELAANVANAIADSYRENLDSVRLNSWRNISSSTATRIEELRANMTASGLALQKLERDLGMVDPEDKGNIVATRLQQLNADYSRAMAERAAKEAAYDSIRGGNPEAAQASPQAEGLKHLMDRRNEALQKFSDIQAIYGDSHPEYKRALAQLREVEDQLNVSRRAVVRRVEAEFSEARLRESNLHKEFSQAKAQSDRLMGSSLAYRTLKQKADSDRGLYDEFVRKLGEAEINAGVQKSGIRIAEPARVPLEPVSPNVPLNCAIALLGSSLLAIGAVIALDSAQTRLRRLEDVRAVPGADVLGTLPSVQNWRRRTVLASVMPKSRLLPSRTRDTLQVAYFEEAVRMLRSSMLTQADRRGVQSLLVASPRGQEGRSTVASQLAVACADLGLKTLLIDGDLRKPSLHTLFFEERPLIGLSNVLKGEVRWQNAVVRQSGRPLLHLIPAGEPASNAAELMSAGMPRLLAETERQCDLVIVDSPPLLEYAQTGEIASAVDAVLLVVRSNQSDAAALHASFSYLERLQADVLGVVVNDLD